LSDPTAIGGSPAASTKPPKYKRRLSNYLLDKKLQLRYVLVVTILSGVIAGALGTMIYQQNSDASQSIEQDTQELSEKIRKGLEKQQDEVNRQLTAPTIDDRTRQSLLKQLDTLKQQMDRTSLADIPQNQHSEDRALVYKMIVIGLSLVIVLSLYLVVMTHKVAGPLFKVSMYYDRMSDGRLGVVTPLRKGDMLQEFFGEFKEMHEAVRARSTADVDKLEAILGKLRESKGKDALSDELDALEKHIALRRKNLT
jgi:nitrogen fixation/metabolism regulation signal transduction histidine kinase